MSIPRAFQPSRRSVLKGGAAFGFMGLAGSGLLSACGSDEPSSAGAGSLSYLSEDTSEVEIAFARKVDEAFKKAHSGVKLSAEDLSADTDFFTKLTTQIAAGNAPDFVPKTTTARSYTLWSQGVLRPADDVIEAIGKDKFAESALALWDTGSGYAGVPLISQPAAFFYRTDLGGTPPTTWDELATWAEEHTTKDMFGIVVPLGRNSATNYVLFNLIRENGGNVVDPDLNVVFDSPQVVEAVEFLAQLAQYSPPGSTDYGYGEQVDLFVNGQVASTYYFGRIFQSVHDDNPDLLDKVAVSAMPYNTEPFDFTFPAGSILFKDSKNQDLAEEYLADFLYSPDFYAENMALLPGQNCPTIPSAVESPIFKESPVVQAFPDGVQLLTDLASSPNIGTYDKESPDHQINTQAAVLDAGTVLCDVVQRVIVDKESAASAVKWGHEQFVDAMEDAVKLG